MTNTEDLSKLDKHELLSRYDEAVKAADEEPLKALRAEMLRRLTNSYWFESINESKRSK